MVSTVYGVYIRYISYKKFPYTVSSNPTNMLHPPNSVDLKIGLAGLDMARAALLREWQSFSSCVEVMR